MATEQQQPTVWALGDYARVAREVLADLGTSLVAACGIAEGQRVLDVATGSGNAAIPAARSGARVVASDITPGLLESGRLEALADGVDIEWVQADAQALPFADAEFDAVISCIGAMFAPDHRATAAELARVCKPGGTIGLLNWTPDGMIGDFFGVFAPYHPPADGPSPLAWGSEDHVRGLLGDAVESLQLTRADLVVDDFVDPREWCEYYKRNFGPTIAAYDAAGPERRAALDRSFLDFATRWNRGRDGRVRYAYEYLLVVATRASA